MRILLFGSTGQVGWELQRSLAPIGETVALGREPIDGLCGNLADLDSIADAVRRVRPDVIVNAAAYTAVDRAEEERDLAVRINGLAPEVLAREARTLGALLVHYSSDYVYDGTGETFRSENDSPRPINHYGETKLIGDETIQAHAGDFLILRTSWVFAARRSNFISTMLRLAGERETLSIVNDQFGAPTGADLIADSTAHCIRRLRGAGSGVHGSSALSGIYHLAAGGVTTWYEYATYVIERARALGFEIAVRRDGISPTTSEEFVTAARRPRNSRLDTTKIRTTFDLHIPSWQPGVDRALMEHKQR